MKKFDYYHVDCGHFPAQIKLCFSNEVFQKVLKDHDITAKATALDEGIAETHYLSDGKMAVIVLVFDLAECDGGDAVLAGVVAHEATHCVCRVFDHIGEEPDEIGEESRAYLTEHIVKQIWKGIKQIHLVELKTATGVLSERQKLVFSELEHHGQTVTIIRSKSDVENFIIESTTS